MKPPPPLDNTKQQLDNCAHYLQQRQVKPNYIWAFFGLIISILSLFSEQSLNLMLLGSFLCLWSCYLKPKFFDLNSPNCLLFWLTGRSFNSALNIGKQINFTLKFAHSLDGHSSPFKCLNGRFLLAHQILSDYFLLGFTIQDLIQRSQQGKHQAYILKAINGILLLNTIVAVSNSDPDQKMLDWPPAYKQPLSLLVNSEPPIAIAKLLSSYYPQLFQKN